ncbi:hypothetical protein NM208_g3325 [Fusarium decemcellulare]|uniref:Uncharacterized protein n=1 Tax=Fusarium decemcellulare TaxID=57161 RepID=A0ACC1SPN1_9HYPO|nr:hypothetical protein NM208_g3325 [Fusarium decemcellulare]
MAEASDERALVIRVFLPNRAYNQPIYPKDDGLRRWLVVLGSFCVLIATFGYVNTFGVFLAYYKNHQLASNSISAINWIGSVQLFCMYFFAPFVGKAFDAGWFRLSFLIGSILHTVGMFALSVSETYAAIFFSQGICQGIGLGLIFLPSQAIISHWFRRQRALALGLAALGSSIGGVVFPVIMRQLLVSSTFENTVQVIGACTTVCLIVANITLATNQLPAEWRKVHMVDHNALTRTPFILFTVGSTLVMWGLYVPIFYLEAFGQAHHLSSDISYYSLSILNGASLFGRLFPNFLGDYFAPLTILTPMCFACGILTFVWLSCTKPALYITFTALYGFFSGGYVSLLPATVASFAPSVSVAGTWLGMVLFCVSFAGLTGTPITGAILDRTESAVVPGYWGPCVFGGSSLFLGSDRTKGYARHYGIFHSRRRKRL